MTVETFETENWKLTLPDGWTIDESDNRYLYFESGDKSIGLYISSYVKPIGTVHNVNQVSDNLDIDRKTMSKMPDNNFVETDRYVVNENGVISGGLDAWDTQNKHRIFVNYLASKNVMVRLSIQDYYCTEEKPNAAVIEQILDDFILKSKILN